MARKTTIGITDLLKKKYAPGILPDAWLHHLGEDLTKRFTMTITGDSGHGKTIYALMLMKVLGQHIGKAFYNSVEQGFSKTLQSNAKLARLYEVAGKVAFGDHLTHEEMMKKLDNKHFRCTYLFTDSRDFMKLTFEQYKQYKQHPRRKHLGIITICQSDGSDQPKSTDGKQIKFDADIKVHVQDFVAYSTSRFGDTKPFVIWEKGHRARMKKLGKASPVFDGGELPLFGDSEDSTSNTVNS